MGTGRNLATAGFPRHSLESASSCVTVGQVAADWDQKLAGAADAESARARFRKVRASPLGAAWTDSAAEVSARALAALLGGSAHFAEVAAAHPEWLANAFAPESLAHGRRLQGLEREAGQALDAALALADHAGALKWLRLFKQREHLRLAAREFASGASTAEVAAELSDLADVCLSATLRVTRARVASGCGEPWHRSDDGQWQPSGLALVALGKLGGRELDYAGTLKVFFVFDEDGAIFDRPPRSDNPSPTPRAGSRAFFEQWADTFVTAVNRRTAEGRLYVLTADSLLDSPDGRLSRSLAECAARYNQPGSPEERLQWMKARYCAGDRSVAAEFIDLIEPFRHPRPPVKSAEPTLISGERARRTGAFEIDIENLVQSLQLSHGGALPFIRTTQTLEGLKRLAAYRLLPGESAQNLANAYRWRQRVTHCLQLEASRPTTGFPLRRDTRERLARLMGARDWESFLAEHRARQAEVQTICADLALAPAC